MIHADVTRIIVVEERTNPSTDFFIRPWVATAHQSVTYAGFSDAVTLAPSEKVALIFVRYVHNAWRKWFEYNQAQIKQVHYFMDDDLFDLHAFKGLPWRYQYKLFTLAYRQQQWLRRQQAQYWVSTRYLQQKYQQLNASLLPASLPMTIAKQTTLFYHGSASHQAEFDWLYPVVETLLQQNPQLSFEMIGDSSLNLRFRQLPRTHILHPMSWQAYQALLGRGGRDIGLAPLLDNPFNRARAYTKYFDITRAGAVGIYSKDSIYAEVVKNNVNGVLVDNSPQAWVGAINQLLQQPDKVKQMVDAAKADVPSREKLL